MQGRVRDVLLRGGRAVADGRLADDLPAGPVPALRGTRHGVR